MRCSFIPYEGNDKYIFISYSHSDSDKVASILEKLNSEGFRIWYDDGIEWGTEWPDAIASHLTRCEVCMAFHSKKSIVSPNCRQEIYYALKMKKWILSVYLEDVELSYGLDMQLSPFQSTFPFQYENRNEFFSRLIKTKVLQDCRGKPDTTDTSIDASNSDVHKSETQPVASIDEQIDTRFKELFGGSKEHENSEEHSPLKKRMESLKAKNFMASINWKKEVENTSSSTSDVFSLFSLLPAEYIDDSDTRKHFTIPDIPGYKTILFEVCSNCDYKSLTKYYTCEALEFSQDVSDDGSTIETVYFIEPPQNGNRKDIVILHFGKDEVFVNTGAVTDDTVKISLEPVSVKLKPIYFSENPCLSSVAYDLNSMNGEQIKTKKDDLCMDADVREDVAILIDLDTLSPVKRELYFDKANNEWRAKINVTPFKSYFAFQIQETDNGSTRRPLSNNEIANCYKSGLYNFPKDLLKAAEYYEKDGSAESLYEIAVLFRTEESILDKDTYLEYLQMAYDAGCEGAKIEHAIRMLFDSHNNVTTEAINLIETIKENNGLKNFLLGYINEKINVDTAFDYYYKAASYGFKAALARLGIERIEPISDPLRIYFKESSNGGVIADYCMGAVLFFGFDIYPQKELGLELLEKSASNGCWMAAESLYYIYEYDSKYEDSEKALKWLIVYEPYDSSLTNTLANKLLDGEGCDICDENDKLAFSLFQKATDAGNKSAQNNLGWMYKNGRGCSIDYEKAQHLFLNAEKASAFYHLGDMYEQGLGVPVDIEIAKHYYAKSAEKGYEKAQKRLEILTHA